jgi:2,4-dienoyl-CoA reductase-like NADH-dependent reductase (Old Yellow Enzyme family)
MASLFEPAAIGSLKLKNRLVRSATWEGMCDPDGRPSAKLIDYYKTLVKGGIGLIITGYTYVSPEGKQLPGKMGIYTDKFKNDFKRLTQAVHDLGGKIAIQLVHAGGQADPKAAGRVPVAPSGVAFPSFPQVPQPLSVLEIEAITDSFAKAARRAMEWGFDGVQIHGAHGYLVGQFLSPLTNQRTDAYGGSLENRSRFLFDIFDKIRIQTGKSYPVFIKMNGSDNIENGWSAQEAVQIAARLSDSGIDAIEVSSGTASSGKKGPARKKIDSPEKEAYNLELACMIKEKVSCPVMCVGGFRTSATAENAVKNYNMDFISVSRPLIREPDLPLKWETGRTQRSECISCNKCFIPGMTKGGIYCVAAGKKTK